MARDAIDYLRDVLRHRLAVWDASIEAERLLGVEIDSEGDAVAWLLELINTADEIADIDEATIREAFSLSPEADNRGNR